MSEYFYLYLCLTAYNMCMGLYMYIGSALWWTIHDAYWLCYLKQVRCAC